MKSTVYPDHPRASASFAYRHLLHCPDGHPNSPAYGHLKLPHLN